MLYSGDFMSFAEAQKIGLIDDIFPTDAVVRKAWEKVAGLSASGTRAFAAIKSSRTEAIKENYEKQYKSRNEIFLDCWFSEPTQRTLKDASQKF